MPLKLNLTVRLLSLPTKAEATNLLSKFKSFTKMLAWLGSTIFSTFQIPNRTIKLRAMASKDTTLSQTVFPVMFTLSILEL